MLFILIHQASELWMKLCLHELPATRAQIRSDDLEPAFKMLSRVARVQMQLIQSWDVLGTMTPADYTRFRDSLGQSSGFQSWQYRLLEFMLGNKDARLIEVHAKDKAAHALLKKELVDAVALRRIVAAALAARIRHPFRRAPIATGHIPMRRTRRSRPPGSRSIATRLRIGISTSLPKSSWTWNTGSSNGASRT